MYYAPPVEIYEGVVGLVIDVKIEGVVSLAGVEEAKLYALPPGAKESQEEAWHVDVIHDDFIFRHIVPQEKPLKAGTYRLQPSFRLGAYNGRFSTVEFTVYERQQRV